jgi:acetyl-CoA/propionyl-CoA carboxylase biotin carboxyl carrier protein
VEWPQAVGIRVDTGVRTGSVIGLDYDAMIAKVTVQAEDRARALSRMLWCLRHTVLFGTVTNVNYLQDILSHPSVQEGKMHVKLLETEFKDWKDPVPEELMVRHSAIVQEAQSAQSSGAGSAGNGKRMPSPWEKR